MPRATSCVKIAFAARTLLHESRVRKKLPYLLFVRIPFWTVVTSILLVTAFAKEAHYTYAMNLNNVCIRISGDFEENRAEDGEGSAVPESLEKT